jgi:hypothetical protein
MNGTKRRPSSSGSTAAVVGAECVDGEMEVVRTGAVEPVTSAKMMVCDLPDPVAASATPQALKKRGSWGFSLPQLIQESPAVAFHDVDSALATYLL